MADGRDPWRNEEEEDEEAYDETNYKHQKDAVIFAIDVSKTMLATPPPSDSKTAKQDSPTSVALKCAYQIMQQRIISNPKDMMGVLLFNTEDSKFQEDTESSRGGLQYPHCYLLTNLDVPSADEVKLLRELTQNELEASQVLVPSEEPVAISNLLFCANQIFTTKAPNFGSRRLFIITDNDDPHADDKNSRSQAAVRAKDLYDIGVNIELFPISHPGHDFDRTKFYDDIVYRDPNETAEGILAPITLKSSGGDGISLLHNLISDIDSKQVAKRTLFSNLPLEIGPGFVISVKGYNIVMEQKPARSCYVYLDGEVAQFPEGKTEQHAGDDAETVQKLDIRKAYKFGGDTVLFTPEEQAELKNFGPPGLRIIGFKPQSMLPHWAAMNKSTFIYPSEDDYTGSTRVFAALWQKLLKDKKMGLGWYIARKNAKPLLVAILPSKERLDETTGAQVVPQGLWLYQLPFADDLRSPPELPTPVVAPDNLVDEMRKVVQQLQLPKATYDPAKYPNPALQWHYRILQAMALDEELPDVPEDKTIPKHRQIHKRAGQFVNNWGLILDEQSRAYEGERSSAGGVKREREDGESGPKKRVKVAKLEQALGEMSAKDLKALVVSDSLGKYKVAELKDLCIAKGLSSTGKKADLLEKVEQWVEEN